MATLQATPTITPETLDALRCWLWHGIVPKGGVLGAVIANDLRLAHQRSNPAQWAEVPAVVQALTLYAPHTAWGSKQRLSNWAMMNDTKRRDIMLSAAAAMGVDFPFDNPPALG